MVGLAPSTLLFESFALLSTIPDVAGFRAGFGGYDLDTGGFLYKIYCYFVITGGLDYCLFRISCI